MLLEDVLLFNVRQESVCGIFLYKRSIFCRHSRMDLISSDDDFGFEDDFHGKNDIARNIQWRNGDRIYDADVYIYY